MARTIAYWVTTGLVAAMSLFAAYGYLSGSPQSIEGFAHVGYPQQLRIILGIAKPLGAIALGAQRRNVLWVVLRETLALGIAGAVTGLVLALAASHLVESLLFGVKPADPLVLALSIAAMIGVALLAGYLPARRATRIDPSLALRYD